MTDVFNWLCVHHKSLRTPMEWASLLGIKILDWDGWTNQTVHIPINIVDFMQGVMSCTIRYR